MGNSTDIFGYRRRQIWIEKIRAEKWNEMRLTRWVFTIVRLQRIVSYIKIGSQ